jgi:hypothetical protein
MRGDQLTPVTATTSTEASARAIRRPVNTRIPPVPSGFLECLFDGTVAR